MFPCLPRGGLAPDHINMEMSLPGWLGYSVPAASGQDQLHSTPKVNLVTDRHVDRFHSGSCADHLADYFIAVRQRRHRTRFLTRFFVHTQKPALGATDGREV